MKKTFQITAAILLGFILSGYVIGSTSTIKSARAQASNPCMPGFCPGLTECDCNGWCLSSYCGDTSYDTSTCWSQSNCPFVAGACDAIINTYHPDTRDHFDEEMNDLEDWIVTDWIQGYTIPGLMAMTEELTTIGMNQVAMIGTFFDAEMELETQRLIQEVQAQGYKDYYPSEGVCVFATNVRGLAMADRKITMNKSILSNRAMSRHLGIKNDAGAEGVRSDFGGEFTSRVYNQTYRYGRLKQFQDQYCNPRDNNEKIKFLCGNSGTGATDDYRVQHDIDFADIFGMKKTINVDFLRTDAETSTQEKKYLEDYLALSKNLYGHKVSYRPAASTFKIPTDFFDRIDSYDVTPYQALIDFRAWSAKRSVAENTYHTQMALKSRGDAEASLYLNALLSELGIDETEIADMLQGAPSYYAQMEILTKKIYQNPQFYIDLYDKPANVKRKQVALKSISLMQDWDIFEATMRIEMLAAILLELGLEGEGKEVQGQN